MSSNHLAVLRDPQRLASLRAAGLLDSGAEPVFDRLTALAHRLLDVPLTMVTLVDADRQVIKSCVGLAEPWASRRETPLTHSFCQYAVGRGDLFTVEDARADPLLRHSPVIRDLGVVSYAGVPLVNSAGHALGAFCVTDTKPRRWTADELDLVAELARSALTEIELRTIIRQMESEQEEQLTSERRRALLEVSLGLRHEVNNAVAGIVLVADLLATREVPEEDRRRWAESIRYQGLRISGVLSRLEDVEALVTRPYAGGRSMIDLSAGRDDGTPE
jgi:GAF domain-containing protein